MKARFFGITNGVLLDEKAETVSGVTHATESGGKIYLIAVPSSGIPTVTVTVLGVEKTITNKYKLGLPSQQGSAGVICDVTGHYLACAQGKHISLLNLRDGTIRNAPEEQEITSISTSGSGNNFILNLL